MDKSLRLIILFVALLWAAGCSTIGGSKDEMSDLRLPRTELERERVRFFVASYEGEGYAEPEAKLKALRRWNRELEREKEERNRSSRTVELIDNWKKLYPKTSRDRREVDQLEKEFEEDGYGAKEARARALDTWRNKRGIRISRKK